jgi:hypothetical protein
MLQHGAAQRALHKRMYQIERQRDVHDDQKLVRPPHHPLIIPGRVCSIAGQTRSIER